MKTASVMKLAQIRAQSGQARRTKSCLTDEENVNHSKKYLYHKSMSRTCKSRELSPCQKKNRPQGHVCAHMHAHSRVRLFMTPWTVARQAPLSMEFSRKEYWSELPFPSSEDLPDPGIILVFLAFSALAGGFFATVPPVKPYLVSIFS